MQMRSHADEALDAYVHACTCSMGAVGLAAGALPLGCVQVAVKVLHHAAGLSTADDVRQLAKEVSVVAALRHPHCLAFLAACTEPCCLVSEYCARGSLTGVLKAAAAGSPEVVAALTWPRRLQMASGPLPG